MPGSDRKAVSSWGAVIRGDHCANVCDQVANCGRTVAVVATMDIDDHPKQCNNLEQEWHLE